MKRVHFDYEKLKTLVFEEKKTFNQVERELGYPRNTLANYRFGTEPGIGRFYQLVDYFKVSPEELLKSEDSP